MWHTERLIGATWTRVAPWGNVDNAKDSAAFLADLAKVRTRVVDSLSLIVVWDSVEGAPSDDLNTQAPTVEEVTEEYSVITAVGGTPIFTVKFPTLEEARANLAASRHNLPGRGTYHYILDSAGFLVPTDDLPTQAREEYTLDGFKVVSVAEAGKVPMGLFAYPVTDNGRKFWYTSCEFPDRRTYHAGPFQTEDKARAEVRRVSATYPNLHWFLIR